MNTMLSHMSVAVIAAGLTGVLATTVVGAQNPKSVTAADTELAKNNLALFDKLDFQGWNSPDWKVFSQLHSKNVKVEGFGQTSEGNSNHVAWAKAFVEQQPDLKITAHPIKIAAGDWTAVTGTMSDGSTMATIAHWMDGQIVEEYLFTLSTGR